MNEFLLVLAATSCLISIAAASSVVRLAARVRELRDQLTQSQRFSPDSVSKRVDSFESKLEELTVTVGEVAQRVKMQRVRAAANHATGERGRPDGEPDPHTDPDGWRAWMNDRLARARLKA